MAVDLRKHWRGHHRRRRRSATCHPAYVDRRYGLNAMCNDYGNRVPHSAYVEAFSQIRLALILPKAAPNLEPCDDIWPTDVAPIIRRSGKGVELAQLRWGLPSITSSAGAMGLMQLMPETWATMRARYRLAADPYAPADNIVAGAGFLRELIDRYGAPEKSAPDRAGAGHLA